MQPQKTKPHIIALGGVAVFLFTVCLLWTPSCEDGSQIMVGPEVSQGIVQETLPYFDTLEIEKTMIR